jgi:hypothetical protein
MNHTIKSSFFIGTKNKPNYILHSISSMFYCSYLRAYYLRFGDNTLFFCVPLSGKQSKPFDLLRDYSLLEFYFTMIILLHKLDSITTGFFNKIRPILLVHCQDSSRQIEFHQ